MARTALREQAIKLRLQGNTYGQIKQKLNLPKSTLSNWLQNLSLSPEQLSFLSNNKATSRDIRIEKYIQTRKNTHTSRLKDVFSSQKISLLPLSDKELYIAGIFLYLGEGSKQHGVVAISNSNPLVIQFAKYWMIEILKIPVEKLVIRLHLYSDMDIKEKINYWSEQLNLPKDQFKKPYIKKSTREGLTYKSYGQGTCNLMCFNTTLSEQIAMSIKAVSEYCGAKNDLFWYN